MIRFIIDAAPAGSQVVLGLENLMGVSPEGPVIDLEQKHKVLRREEFSTVGEEVRFFLDRLVLMRA